MNPLKKLHEHGQAPWLDYVSRTLLESGELATMIERDGLRGVTSNPSIFQQAIAGSDDYQGLMEEALADTDCSVTELFERLAIADIQAAADVLRRVYEVTGGDDGYVSLEVSPYLAHDSAGTIAEARRLWEAVDRPNLMVKVPATQAGLPAIRQLVADGINVNVTLLFSQDAYARVVEAYMAGLEQLVANGGDAAKVASVASFFVSRIDSAVDAALDAREGGEPLRGKAAIANAKLAYQRYLRLFDSARWKNLADAGARPQRLLWASTSTKDPAYRDTLYVEELIGPDTVNTIPPATMEAFRDHGEVSDTLQKDVVGAAQTTAKLAELGVDFGSITEDLVAAGVQKFADSFDDLLGAVAVERERILGARLDAQSMELPDELQATVDSLAEEWRAQGTMRRIWDRDASVWTARDEDRWLGWLDAIELERSEVDTLDLFAESVRQDGFRHVVVLGMGGSSLGVEVIAEVLGSTKEAPALHVLDSTDPQSVRRLEASIDVDATLFVVASKSGSTLEPNILFQYFRSRVANRTQSKPFVAVTDPGSKLDRLSRDEDFRATFYGEPTIGGRFSVLSNFGMVAAAAGGLPIDALLDEAERMARSCGADVPPAHNPGAQLGLALGAAANAGRDKLTFLMPDAFGAFGAWAEQLVAESTGKQGHGIIPIDGEAPRNLTDYGTDRFFVLYRVDGSSPHDELASSLAAAGHPVVTIELRSPRGLFQEFFRWQMATAVAGAVLGVNPFDQPDVEASKIKTRALTDALEKSGALPSETPFASHGSLRLFADAYNADELTVAAGDDSVGAIVRAHLDRVGQGDYVALLAYVDRNDEHQAALQALRERIAERTGAATAVGFGPRFLHSTGQAYKGGPDSGVFLQITSRPQDDVDVPGASYTFGEVEAAQARGDFDVLAERGRRALRLHIDGDVAAGIEEIRSVIA